jgi:hypothetical protein
MPRWDTEGCLPFRRRSPGPQVRAERLAVGRYFRHTHQQCRPSPLRPFELGLMYARGPSTSGRSRRTVYTRLRGGAYHSRLRICKPERCGEMPTTELVYSGFMRIPGLGRVRVRMVRVTSDDGMIVRSRILKMPERTLIREDIMDLNPLRRRFERLRRQRRRKAGLSD